MGFGEGYFGEFDFGVDGEPLAVGEPIGGYKCTLDLGFEVRDGWTKNAIIDYGMSADEYTSSVLYIADNGNQWPERVDGVSQVVSSAGYYPFGPHMVGDVTAFMYPKYEGKASGDGSYHKWSVDMVPDMDGVYNYVNYATFFACSISGFTFGPLANFPVPYCSPVSDYNMKYNRMGNVVGDYDTSLSTNRRRVKMEWKNISGMEAGALLSYIVSGVRSFPFMVDFTNIPIANVWAVRTGETGSIFQVRLSSKTVDIEHVTGDLWNVAIEVMKWE